MYKENQIKNKKYEHIVSATTISFIYMYVWVYFFIYVRIVTNSYKKSINVFATKVLSY